MKVLMVYPKLPKETFWNFDRALRRFTSLRTSIPPLGLLTLASYLPPDFDLRLIDRNCFEETDGDWEWADVVFLSVMLAQREDYEYCVAQAKRHGKPIAVGGPLTHALPDVAIADADWVCFGEAESIIDSLVADLRSDSRGKQYQGGNSTNMTAVPAPRFDLLPQIHKYGTMPVQFSRGCPFRCEFCDIIEIYGRVPRTKTSEQVLHEMTLLVEAGYRGHVLLVDDNFIGNKKNAKILLRDLAVWGRERNYPFRFYTEASLNLADDEELLDLMFEANFVSVFIGIETPEPKLLKGALKLQNIPGDPLAKLNRIRQHGIHITAGFIIGFDGEQREVVEAQQAFIEASGIGCSMAGLLQALPNTELHRRLQRENRLIENLRVSLTTTVEGMNFVPKGELTKREYLQRYSAMVKDLYTPKAFFERVLRGQMALQFPRLHAGLLRGGRNHVGTVARVVYHFGVQSRSTRRHFWRALLTLAWKNFAGIEGFLLDTFSFYYLQQHAVYVHRELARYLESPSSTDVLDQIALEPKTASHGG